MNIYTYQCRGTTEKKTEMEDRILVWKNILSNGYHHLESDSPGIVGLFDGVGGQKGSAFASSFVANRLSHIQLPVTSDGLRDNLRYIHERLIEHGETATTASGLVWNDKSQVLLFHIGNTRIWGMRYDYLIPMTKDQTKYEDMKYEGIDEKNIPHSFRNVLNACMGIKKDLINPLIITDITANVLQLSKIIITSDGIHDYVSIDDLEAAFKVYQSEESLKHVVEAAIKAGSKDDLSVLVCEL